MRRAASARSGLSLAEVVVVGLAAVLLAVPIMGTLSISGHEAMTSQDYMLASAVARRYLNEAMAQPWTTLQGSVPVDRELRGIPPGDEALCRDFPEYARAVAGSEGYRGRLVVGEIEPGLLKIEVSLDWPVRPGSSSMRHYALVRFRAQWDLALRSGGRLSAGRPAAAPPQEVAVEELR